MASRDRREGDMEVQAVDPDSFDNGKTHTSAICTAD
jgi:hypothetical protein